MKNDERNDFKPELIPLYTETDNRAQTVRPAI